MAIADGLVQVHEPVTRRKPQADLIAVASPALLEVEFQGDCLRLLRAIVQEGSRTTCLADKPLQRTGAHEWQHAQGPEQI